ncbi:MAG TPA: hypothetical protein VJJ27_00945, partial [Candidatus Paceibacterota bacterium]
MRTLLIAGLILLALFAPERAQAVAPDFIIGPAKREVFLEKGQAKSFSVLLVNRLGKTTDFKMSASALLSDQDGNLVPSTEKLAGLVNFPREILVKNGETKTFNVTVAADKNEEPGSRALGIFVEPAGDTTKANISAHSRGGIIVIVKILGEAIQSGTFSNLKISEGKITLSFANTGSVHLNPYGIVVIKNIFGREVAAEKIDPWYVMPQTERNRTIALSTENLFGRYVASVMLNRGYGDHTDTRTASFYIFPFWFPVLLAVVLIVLIFWFSKKGLVRGAMILALLLAGVMNVHAQMSSSNYKVQFDSVNLGGGLSTSTSYKQESTFGEVATGESNSANYNIHAGYQQMNEVFLSMTSAADVTLAPNLSSLTGGTANGSTTVTVTTDGAAGYALYVNASTSPALAETADSFADYVPASANPDFSFSVGNSQSFFGFSPEGTDTASRFLDNGGACATGALNTADSCWDGFTTTTKIISENSGLNTPS